LRSFSAAAKVMYITQPAVTQQIHALEKELDIQLIERGKQSFILTNAGEKFYTYAEAVVDMTEKITTELQSMSNHETSHLDVYIFNHMQGYLLDILDHFYAVHPNIIIEINFISPREISDTNNLKTGALYFADQEWITEPNIHFFQALTCPIHCFLSEKDPLALLPSVTPQDLSSSTLYTVPLLKVSRFSINGVCQKILSSYPNMNYCIVPNFNSGLAKIRSDGHGFYMAPGYLAPMVSGIVAVPLNSDDTITAGFIYRGKASKIMKTFLEYIHEQSI
jgi:DNA-binding transcriptional LysR family regulator